MIKLQENIYFSSNNKDMDFEMIFNFIKNSYWGESRTYEEQKIAFENTINFGLFKQGNQIAYARVMTDKVFFAYLLDVFVIEEEQGKGYSKLLINEILNESPLKNIDKWMLATKDAHTLYEKFGFNLVKSPEKLMEKLSKRAKLIYE
ncbi:GNAT family N-acetyltransferase [Pseudotenacibaculum sp. MALMAid0570]|uniref:GNAT family N-acetyltransferase n=1 Tax=Pseudotenacibaculum sp. MALMAid0570 TaxID=3143938 RepID=UPI0032DE5BD2